VSLFESAVSSNGDSGDFATGREQATRAIAAGVIGYFVAPWVALVIFLALPVFYGITSEGLYGLPGVARRA